MVVTSNFLDIYWYDNFLIWNPDECANITWFYIDPSKIWIPDLKLYNSIEDFDSLMSDVEVIAYPNAQMWWSRPGKFSFSCNFDLRDFPFDTQICSAQFNSNKYSEGWVNLTFNNPKIVILDTFYENLAWEIKSIEPKRNEVLLFGYDTPVPFLTYSLKMKRYSNYYMSSAIGSSLAVTFITILTLWIDDITSRLGIAVTALLTIIAVQWTVSSQLPITRYSIWMSSFANMCIGFIGLICLECCIVLYMKSMKDQNETPKWIQLMILITKPCDCFQKIKDKHETSKKNDDLNNIEMKEQLRFESFSDNANKKMTEGTSLSNQFVSDASWSQGARALDRLSRVVVPIAYIIMIAIYFL